MILVVSDNITIENSYTISSSKNSTIQTPKFKNLEECENWFTEKNIDLNIKDENVLICLSGGDSLSGAALYICENLSKKGNKIHVVYFIQEASRLSSNERLNNKIAANILQEYARSGLIESIYLINLNTINKIYENIPILKYKNYENIVINDICNFINWTFLNSEPIYGKNTEHSEVNRIRTISYVFLENSVKIDFFELDMTPIAEKKFYFLMSENELDNNSSALNLIKSICNTEDLNSSFAVYNIGNVVKSNHYCINSTNLVKMVV
jgi:hypothetical protein